MQAVVQLCTVELKKMELWKNNLLLRPVAKLGKLPGPYILTSAPKTRYMGLLLSATLLCACDALLSSLEISALLFRPWKSIILPASH
uniref:Uncharacterized protein n=1 Tax=Manihot esculenta TaxID=3983 RepID=A0A2C9VSD9_MANES